MRGTPAAWPALSASKWIIPAYAGNTSKRFGAACRSWDHPRVCGEHPQLTAGDVQKAGSSPRMRGTPLFRLSIVGNAGIIPAYAGNTNRLFEILRQDGDHPRVCGEHYGVSPFTPCALGSSPRMRGTLARRFATHLATGIIPAYAGNTDLRRRASGHRRDHPRVCGEH